MIAFATISIVVVILSSGFSRVRVLLLPVVFCEFFFMLVFFDRLW